MTLRTSPPQLSFSSGEISPLLYRRSDYQRFQTGLRTCNGFLPLRQGGVTRMPGTEFLGETHENREAGLLSFKFSEEDSAVLEFTEFAMRVWRYGTLIESAPGVPFVLETPYDLAALKRLQFVQSADVIYIVDGVLPPQRLARFALDDWQIGPWLPENGPFQVEQGDKDVFITSSGATGTITLTASVDAFEAGDVGALIRLEPESYPNIPLWRAEAQLVNGRFIRFEGNVYRLDTGAATGGSPPIHESGIEEVAPMSGGQRIKYEFISKGFGVARIVAVADARVATAEVIQRLPPALQPKSAIRPIFPELPVFGDPEEPEPDPEPAPPPEEDFDATTKYRFMLGSWSDRAGYPAAVEIFNQRLCFAATPTEPRTVWFSVVGDLSDFTPGTEADDSFAFAIAGQNTLNKIVWLKAGSRALHIGALGDEYSTRSDARNVAIGPTTAVFGIDSSIGSRPHRPIAPDGQLMFISRDQRRVFQSRYSLEEDRAQPVELSLPSEHIGAALFREFVWQESPLRTVWLALTSGDLAVMVHDPAEDVLGWARCSIAGGAVQSIAIETDPDSSDDLAVLCVRRVINGVPRFMIERQSQSFVADPEIAPTNHLFSARRFAFEVAQSDIALPHLAGLSVLVVADGEEVTLSVAGDGTLSLPAPVASVLVGLLDATHELETLDVTASAADGNTLGRPKRLHAAAGASFHKTGNARIAVIERNLGKPDMIGQESLMVPASIPYVPGPPLSGVMRLTNPSGHAQEVSYRIRPVGNAPLTLTGLTPRVQETG